MGQCDVLTHARLPLCRRFHDRRSSALSDLLSSLEEISATAERRHSLNSRHVPSASRISLSMLVGVLAAREVLPIAKLRVFHHRL